MSEDALGNILLDIVLSDGSDTFAGIGEVDGNGEGNSFSTTGSPHELPSFLASYRCIEILDYEYDANEFVTDDFGSDTAGFVTRYSSITCRKGTDIRTCDVTYTGSAYRTSKPE